MSGSAQLVGPGAVYSGLPTQTALQRVIPAYLYRQYADDDNLQALTQAQNSIAADYLAWFNNLNLPIYTRGLVAGPLLDWVAAGLYGQPRPSITTGNVRWVAETNSYETNFSETDGDRPISTLSLQSINDDIFRRMLTWNLYKGDGFVFCLEWLKRRVARFVLGVNGTDPGISQTLGVAASVAAGRFSILAVAPSSVVQVLNALIRQGFCVTSFQYQFTVLSVASLSAGLFSNGGVLGLIVPPAGYPTSPSGLNPGQLYSNSGVVGVAGITTPNPGAAPVYYTNTSAASLLLLGGGNLPITPPAVSSGQLWNNGGEVTIA